ncbi:MAG: DMT family transporter [Archaeoglobaceae archaeon]|nr:DMT family transporter [Archaeoglobaceae archaeon]MCX8152025.1 DMT family transporter [Archaeoglobaceae archaeon]MDW8013582.1 EamA family transporter [Archaeoglobaceae archaeon]
MKGEGAIISAAIMMSTVSIFVREIEGNALSVAFVRFSSASAFLLAFIILMKIRVKFSKILVILASLNTLTVSCYIYAIQNLEVATAALLLYMAPVYVLLISFLIGEKVERRSILAIVFGLLGLYLMLSPYPKLEFSIIVAVFSGLFYALVFIITKKARESHDPIEISTFNVLLGAILLLPFFLYDPVSAEVLVVIAIGLIPTALPFTLFAYGIKYVKVQRAPIISLIEPVSAAFIGYIYFGEILSVIQLFGAVLVLFSIFLTSS